MVNGEVVRIFYEMAALLEIKEVQWKPAAYRKAAMTIESLSKDLTEIYKKGGKKALEALSGIGEGIASKIIEYIETEKIKTYQRLKKEIPIDITGLMKIESLGPKTIKRFYKELNIKNVKELAKAARAGKIRKLEGFGEKTEWNISKAVAFAKKSGGKNLLGYALEVSNQIVDYLKKSKDIKNIEIAGSIRRRVETIRDVDVLITASNPKKAMDHFLNMGGISRVVAKGTTKSTVMYGNMQVDVRVLEPKQFGSALMYFTGSKNHNIALRKIAIRKGYKLSEYGLFKKDILVASKTESEIYKKLGMQYVPPELRENRGEIEAARDKKLPKLVQISDIRGDLHSHSEWSDGESTIGEMGRAAKRIGHKYLVMSDHAGMLKIAGALGPKAVKKYCKKIDKANDKLKGFTILKGLEVDIKLNGSLALPDRSLKELDVVIGAIHTGFKRDNTKRIVKALDNRYVDILAHPTGRLLTQRQGYRIDVEKVIAAAKRNDKAIEINASPSRLDFNDVNAKAAVDEGVKLAIGTDSHHTSHLKFYSLGVSVARRAWAKKSDILNTYPLTKLKKLLAK